MSRRLAMLSLVSLLLLEGCGHTAKPPDSASAAATRPAASATHGEMMSRIPATLADWARGAMLFDGLGNAHRPITTSSAKAQQYFDQGLRLMWAFNHDEATRSFAKAAELDPTCASCLWGVSLTVGPNYNLPFMTEERAKVAWQALGKAQQVAARATPLEQALIAALAKRYPTARALDPSAAHQVLTEYADAMRSVAERFPQDLDVQTLYAEALMNLNAWKLWTPEGTPAPGTDRIVATLESVLARDPSHAGANHYYIHAMEASPHPEQALAAAERVKSLMPAAGHLVHMPAHILQRVGRYEDAAEANRRAAAADEAYVAHTAPLDYYPTMYTAHNYQFLAYATAMEGRRAETLAAVDASRRTVSDDMLLAMPGVDWYVAQSYAALVRFGLWDEMLATPAPNPKLVALTGGFLYGRGVALAARGRLDEARAALLELRQLAASAPADAGAGQNTVKDVLAIAIPIVEARIATAERRPDEAIAQLRQAVAAEDRLAYDEPKNWFFPARHLLGAQLLDAHRAVEAERVYREDLRENPMNGWALYGLRMALKAQGKVSDSEKVAKEFAGAWQHADIVVTASAF
jgi:tetratricopeptide (TPR) repeat protein